jgi:hypothetical protein
MAKISIFSQIIKLIPRTRFESAVTKFKGDRYTRTLDCWTWFGALVFSQLSGHDSIRALQKVFEIGNPETSKLGFTSIRRSTLSDANSRRPVAILREMFSYSLDLAYRARGKRFEYGFPVYLMDSTFIELCLSLCPWAFFGRNRVAKNAGIKVHTAIDLTGHLPEFLVIKAGTEKTNNDALVARKHFRFKPGSLVVFDRGYSSASYLNELNKENVGFVTRFKNKKVRFRVVKSEKVDRTQGIICDQSIYFSGEDTKGKYTGQLRRIKYRDSEANMTLVFITNRFDLPAKVICDLYKSRWQVEIFFRTLKQNLKIKKFLGLSKNAVLAQIYAALICYILLSYLKMTARSSISMTELMAVVGTLLLLKHNILELIQNRPKTTRHPPPQQLEFTF